MFLNFKMKIVGNGRDQICSSQVFIFFSIFSIPLHLSAKVEENKILNKLVGIRIIVIRS